MRAARANRAATAGGIVTLALLAAILPSVSAGRGARSSATSAPAGVARTRLNVPPAGGGPADASGGVVVGEPRRCPLAVRPDGYVNPLARARVKPERVDQGVDYAGSGPLSAIGAGTVTHVATSDTGWPGAFIEYRLSGGADAGCYVYYAEGVTPATGLRVGDAVRAGQAIATIIPGWSTGIEIGWGSGIDTKSYAAVMGQWNATNDADSVASPTGKSFSALIAALGGPPGKVEG